MDRGNWLPPGYDNGRPHAMIYIDTAGDGWEMDKPVPDEEERMYQLIESCVPASFRMVDTLRDSWEVFMENDHCEIILSRERNYFAVAFVGKEKPEGGWYTGWQRTADRLFKKLFKEGFELHVRTGDCTSAPWTPDTSSAYIAGLRRKYKETGRLELATEMV